MSLDVVVQRLLGSYYNENEVEALFGLKTLLAKASFLKPAKTNLFDMPKKLSRQEAVLSKYRYYCTYLQQRGISERTADKYDIGFDETNQQITFPLRDINGNTLGIGRRSVIHKRYEYPQGMVKPLYGIYELPQKIRSLFIVEGPFNLWSLSEWGKNGVALLGTGTNIQYTQLLKLYVDNYVLALDPDDAGRRGIKKLIKFLVSNHKFNIFVMLLSNGRDINDLTEDEFKNTEVIYYRNWLSLFNGGNDEDI